MRIGWPGLRSVGDRLVEAVDAQVDRTRGHRDCFDVIREPTFVRARDTGDAAPGEWVLDGDLTAGG